MTFANRINMTDTNKSTKKVEDEEEKKKKSITSSKSM